MSKLKKKPPKRDTLGKILGGLLVEGTGDLALDTEFVNFCCEMEKRVSFPAVRLRETSRDPL